MWYGPLGYPEASGRLNTEGIFLDGAYNGTVTAYYPSGAKKTVRVYDHGILKSCQYWSPEGVEYSPTEAVTEANRETESDMRYIAADGDGVTRALAQAHRKIQQ
jgi:antitoxin component YwqK of YwqJK toxin-antitoxin module